MKRALILVALLGLTVTACAEPSEEASVDPTESSWTLQSGTLDGEEIPVLDTHPITLTFEEDQVSGTAACNGYFGGYTIEGTELSFSDLGQTMMACEPSEVMDSESGYLAALAVVDSFEATEDQLTMTGGGAELVFAADS